MTAPQRLTQRKREAILAAAIAEFRVNGFEVTSMDRIAATAGVSKRTVYNHFPSKEELFAEILNQLWASSVAQLDVSYAGDRPLREQLRGLLEAKMKMMSDVNFLDLARVAIAATIHSPERAQDMVNRLSMREEGFTQWVRAPPRKTAGSRVPTRPSPRTRFKACSRRSPSGRRSPSANPPSTPPTKPA